MIIRKVSTLYLGRLATVPRYGIVKNKDLDEIRRKYDHENSKWEKIKMYGHIFQHIGFKGFKHFRDDFKSYLNLRFFAKDLTEEQKIELMRMKYDIVKTGPLIFIQILPFSGPLFLLYMYVYPESIPSWFIIDTFHNDGVLERQKAQQNAIKYFEEKGAMAQDIDFNKMNLDESRKLSQLLFGYYRDGVRGYNKLFKKNIRHFITEGISRRMVKRKLESQFQLDLINQHIHKEMSLDEKIKWKFEQVMLHKKYHVGQLIPIEGQTQDQIREDHTDDPVSERIHENVSLEHRDKSHKGKE